MSNLEAFSAFTMLCSDYLCLVPKYFHHPKGDLAPIEQLVPIPFSPQPQETTNLLSVLWIYLFLDIL